jgi:hypothetical protein
VAGEQDQLVDLLRMPGGEDRGHGAALGESEQRRPLDLGGVLHRADVIDALLQRQRAHEPVRHPGTALVEPDEPGERRQRLVEPPRQPVLQLQLDMRHPAGDVHEVDGTAAHYLKRDVDIAAQRIPCLRHRDLATD